MYFLTLLYLQRQNFGASQTVLCRVQLYLSLSGSYVKLFHESKMAVLPWQAVKGARAVIAEDMTAGWSALWEWFLFPGKLIFLYLAAWSYFNRTIIVVLKEKNQEESDIFPNSHKPLCLQIPFGLSTLVFECYWAPKSNHEHFSNS